MKFFVLTLLLVVVLVDAPFDVDVVVVVVAKAKSALVLLTELHWFPKDNRRNNVIVISRNPFFSLLPAQGISDYNHVLCPFLHI